MVLLPKEGEIHEYEDFLDDEHIENIIKRWEPLLQPSKMVEDDKLILKLEQRDSKTVSLHYSNDNEVKCLQNKLGHFFPERDIRCYEIQLLKYDTEGHYMVHNDFLSFSNGFRDYSMFIYLNDNYEGGHTGFPNMGVSIKPLKGKAIFWKNTTPDNKQNNTMMHQGNKVTRGIKHAINIFISTVPNLDNY